jgi:hypothetical protein
MIYTLDITSSNGTPFRVLAIPGSVQGPNRHRAPAGREYAIVEFHDRRHPHDLEVGGQFTGGYYDIRTLLDQPGGLAFNGPIGSNGRGLSLDGGIPAWTVDGEACQLIHGWLTMLDSRGLLV